MEGVLGGEGIERNRRRRRPGRQSGAAVVLDGAGAAAAVLAVGPAAPGRRLFWAGTVVLRIKVQTDACLFKLEVPISGY